MTGKCYFCGKEVTGGTAKRHAKTCKALHEREIKKGKEERKGFIIKITDKYVKDYYMYIMMDASLRLEELDRFLRDIWCECCGHLSAFRIDEECYNSYAEEWEPDLNIRLREVLMVGGKFTYEYDFGTSTDLMGEIVEEVVLGKDEPQIEIIIRNNKIGRTNSPREGECGYTGDLNAEKRYLPNNKTKLITKAKLDKEIENRKDIEDEDIYGNEAGRNIEDMFENMFREVFEDEFSRREVEKIARKLEKRVSRSMKRKTSWSLEKLIEDRTKDEIKDLLDILEIRYKKSEKKADLKEKYLKNCTESYNKIFRNISESMYNDLLTLKNNSYMVKAENIDIFENIAIMEGIGISYLAKDIEKGMNIFVPKELIEIIEDFEFDIEEMKKHKQIIEFIRGLVRVYGVIEENDVMDSLKEYELVNEDMGVEELELIMGMEIEIDEIMYVDNFIINKEVTCIEEVIEIVDADGDYKKFSKDEILESKSIDEMIHGKKFKELREFFAQFDMNEQEKHQEIKSLYCMYQLESRDEISEHIDDTYGMPDYAKKEFEARIIETFNKVPCWKLKGFSQNELKNKNYEVINSVKVGRNEECPCGSGKKFKKCCGKNVIEVDFTKVK
ncbi:MAG: SEC-C metal-binding domain-containing protein [Clostridium sp.]|uniref:SEC-C metal-binding domain-containing protein n=1 Tax=Clostridium sp. TaxID=1506 RepID=UPI003F2F0658